MASRPGQGSAWPSRLGVSVVTSLRSPRASSPLPLTGGHWVSRHVLSSPHRVSVPLLRTLDQMLANGCFDAFTTDAE